MPVDDTPAGLTNSLVSCGLINKVRYCTHTDCDMFDVQFYA